MQRPIASRSGPTRLTPVGAPLGTKPCCTRRLMLFNAVNGNGPRRSQFCALQALMLRLSGEPFSFRYISFQKGMHKAPEFFGPISLGAGTRPTRRCPRPAAVAVERRPVV